MNISFPKRSWTGYYKLVIYMVLGFAFFILSGLFGRLALSSGDTTPPSAPGNVNTIIVSPTHIDVTWSAASDDTGVTAYQVYLNGNLSYVIPGSNTGFGFNNLTPATTYSF